MEIKIPQGLEMIKVSELKPYENNARVHSPKQVQEIMASMKEFGFTNPILIGGSNNIIAGHGRLEAARMLGLTEVPFIRLGHLTPEQTRAYILADNQLALNSTWDEDLLAKELCELSADDFGLDVLGFDDDFLESILPSDPVDDYDNKKTKVTQGAKEYSEDEFDVFDHTCPKCGFEFNDN